MNEYNVGDTLYRIDVWDEYSSSTISSRLELLTCTVVKVSKTGLVYTSYDPKCSRRSEYVRLLWSKSKREAIEKAQAALTDYTKEVLRDIENAQNKLTEMSNE